MRRRWVAVPSMGSHLLQELQLLDHAAVQASEAVRWSPATALFVLASAWWVKGPLFVAVGAVADLRARRPLPLGTVLAAGCAVVASLLVALLKESFDRERPPLAHPEADALVPLPDSASFPSGHAATAFAAAAAVSALHPRLRVPLYGIAVLVALSRVYLGVHFLLDVIAGAILGAAIGYGAVRLWRRVGWRIPAVPLVP